MIKKLISLIVAGVIVMVSGSVVSVGVAALLLLLQEILLSINATVGAGNFLLAFSIIVLIVSEYRYLMLNEDFKKKVADSNIEYVKNKIQEEKRIKYNMMSKMNKEKDLNKRATDEFNNEERTVAQEVNSICGETSLIKRGNERNRQEIYRLNSKKEHEVRKITSKYYRLMNEEERNHSNRLKRSKFLKLTPSEILNSDSYALKNDFTGIYILRNKSLNKYYVGQSLSVMRRMRSHFLGSGNKDVYRDYVGKDNIWETTSISLSDSGFRSLNELERHYIELTGANVMGYNKTKGNRN